MMKHRFTVAACLWFVSLSAAPTIAAADDDTGADWPQWRGPDRTGVSPETGWSPASREQSLWTKQIGFGHSSFSIADGRLYAMGYDLERKVDVVHCLNPETGEEIWTHTYPAEFWNEGHDGGTCTTPTVHGDVVYTSNREGRVYALNATTGEELWTRELQPELSVKPPRWGFSGSPVVVGDLLVINAGKLAALNRETGSLQWVSEKNYGNAYSTPTEYDFNGRPSVLVLNGLGLAAIDRDSGDELAFHDWTMNPERAIYGATPVLVNDKIFISAASGGGCAMLEATDANAFDVVWANRAMRNNYAGCVLYRDHLYGFDNSILKCIDVEGNEKWRKRGIGVGAMLVVGDRLLIIGAKGELIIAEANPNEYVELSRDKVLEGGAYWATPVLSHGLVYARNSLGDMVCRDYRTGAGTVAKRQAPTELPPADTLLADHVKAIGGADALRRMTAARFSGQGEMHGAGPIEHCDAEMTWSAEGGFVWRFASGLDFGYNPRIGWSQSMMGPQILEDDRIARLREVGDLHQMLTPNWGFTSLRTTDARVFDDRMCYVVTARRDGGDERTLYFEVDTGRLAGREGEDVPLWTFDDYRPVGDLVLPMEWAFFASGSGSMTMANFADVAFDIDDPARLEPPRLIRMMTRTDEEKEAENVRLRAAHGDLAGSYKLATGSMAGLPLTIAINNGGIEMSFGGQPPEFLSEPDDEGRLFSMANPKIYIATERTSSGPIKMVVWAYGDKFGELERAEEG